MAKFDLETLLSNVKSYLQANLNTQITALNAEKNDGTVLLTVDSSAYHLETAEDRAEPHDPFVIYGEWEDPEPVVVGPAVAMMHHVGIMLVLAHHGADLQIVNRLLRYRRALQDTVISGWDKIAYGYTATLKTWVPGKTETKDGFTGWFVGIVVSVSITD